jgi:cation diffusion facilitator CzcD-associated flavoprotein CzcO
VTVKKAVCVIGAGPSGLIAMKELLDEGHTVTCFDHNAELGGVFRAGAGTDEPGAYDSTLLTISNYMMAFSCFPPPEKQERRFWTAIEYRQYLHDFADAFGLRTLIRPRTDVLSVARNDSGDGYVVETAPVDDPAARISHQFDAVVVSSGTHRVPNKVGLPGQEDFAGVVTHSAFYRNAEPFRGKRVLCVGIGETAADVVNEIAQVAASCTLSIRRWQSVVARFPGDRPHPNDAYTSEMLNALPLSAATAVHRIGMRLGKRFGKTAANRAIAAWNSNNKSFFNHFLTKNDAFIHRIVDGTLTVNASGIERLGADHVVFKDGRREQIDTIMLNTGYTEDFTLLKDVHITDVRQMYKHMIHPELGTGVVFIGWARPAAGGVPACSEMQARYFALLCSGKRMLPPPEQLNQLIKRQATYEDEFFTGNPELRTLVHYNRYMIDFARVIGCSPWRPEVFRNPRLAYHLWCGSQVPLVFRLHGPHSDRETAQRRVLELPVAFNPAEIILATALTGVTRALGAVGLVKRDGVY